MEYSLASVIQSPIAQVGACVWKGGERRKINSLIQTISIKQSEDSYDIFLCIYYLEHFHILFWISWRLRSGLCHYCQKDESVVLKKTKHKTISLLNSSMQQESRVSNTPLHHAKSRLGQDVFSEVNLLALFLDNTSGD